MQKEGEQKVKKEEHNVPELSEEKAAQILRNVFAACNVTENEIPFEELQRRSREHLKKRTSPETFFS